MNPMSDVLDLDGIDRRDTLLVGGKAANLGELRQLAGVRVPSGFCVTTEAYRRVVASSSVVGTLLDRLARLHVADPSVDPSAQVLPELNDLSHLNELSELSAEIRAAILVLVVPDDLRAEIGAAADRLDALGSASAWAVRSSATTEDLPSASFAGQHDTSLNVVGLDAVTDHVRRCWASLFTARAVAYRLRHGIDPRSVHMAVVVQQMVDATVAGVAFTAEPVTGDRTITSIEAAYGLGEALVSGQITPDTFRVRGGEIIDRVLGAKTVATMARPGGGTGQLAVPLDRRERLALTDDHVLTLERLGRLIEAHQGDRKSVV
jgi:pyruvate,water dikinase